MCLIKLKPVTPGFRNKIKIRNNVYKGKPFKKLCIKLNNKSGRNNTGRITIRHKGNRVKKKYRLIDFKRLKYHNCIVKRIEHDPNRNSYIALVEYLDGVKNYIISPKGLLVGDKLLSGENIDIKLGNCLMLKYIPIGVKIHCLEMIPGKGAQLIRSAGAYGILISKEYAYVAVSLKSGEIRRFNPNCRAVIGQVSNDNHNLIKLGKAGANRLKGIRPTVRGVAMNPVDHPHGGGEGKTSGGRDPVTPQGVPTKGFKTRKKKNINIIKYRFKKN